jgi:hypothetical protein
MKVIKPIVFTDAMLVSSTVAEPAAGEPAWNPATAYAKGAIVTRPTNHKRYERAVAGTTATAPEADTANWIELGPTNRWAMLDRKVGTATKATSITAVFRPGPTSGIAALEMVGRQFKATMREVPGGNIVHERTAILDGTIIESVYDWLFSDYEQLTDVVFTDFPAHYPSCEITIELTGTTDVSLGVLQFGQVIDIGRTQSGASVGIIDNSRKERDTFGNVDVVERTYSKRCSLSVVTEKADFNKIYRRLASLRATPCIYMGTEQPGYEPMIIYGFFKDFGISVDYLYTHILNIEIEGL